MLTKFGKLIRALEFAYPEIKWDERKFSLRGKKSTQRYASEFLHLETFGVN
jgi:hypothetical protein